MANGVMVVSLALMLTAGVGKADTRDSNWEIAHQPLPALPDGVASRGVGCVVVGMSVQGDGSIRQPMVLQGAFNGHVTQQQQELFAAAVTDASRSWKFRFVGGGNPTHGYVVQSIGFGPGDGSRVVAGIEAQAEPLRKACHVEDLAAWGERHAIPVDEAVTLHGGRTAIGGVGGDSTLWISRQPITPPRYPSAGLEAGTVACVVLGFRVDSAGKTTDFKIMGSRTEPAMSGGLVEAFENASLVAASEWTYSPTPANLQRLPEFRQVPVDYAMDGSPAPPCPELDLGTALEQAAGPAPTTP